MTSSIWTRTLAVSMVCAALGARAEEPAAGPNLRVALNIKAQPVREALQAFGEQSGLQVLFRSEGVKVAGVKATPVSGEMPASEALGRMLETTGLKYEFINAKTVRIAAAADETRGAAAPAAHPAPAAAPNANESATKSPAGEGASSSADKADPTAQQLSGELREVLVSAQKRGDERLKDVPIPISVVDAGQLSDNGKVLLRDYYSSVPGMNLAPNYIGRQQISIRGVMTGGGSNPTVAITIDDVPNGASTDAAGGSYIPDLDAGDLQRVEVLRGPQGTLYGANSMGGLIRYVTVDPSVQGYSGRIEAGTNFVYNGHEPSYVLRGSTNVPVSDTFAVRASAFTRADAGYIDNPFQHKEGVNSGTAYGGRLSALWLLSDTVSLKLSGLYQSVSTDGSPEVQRQPGLGDLQQNFLPDTRGYDRSVQTYSALLKAGLGSLELTSLTGFNINDQTVTDDRGPALGNVVNTLYGVRGVRYELHSVTHKFTQELRLAGPIGPKFDWMVGTYYTTEDSPTHTTMVAENTTTGALVGGDFYDFHQPNDFNERAGFANLTFHVTDRLDLQFGGRYSRQHLVYSNVTTGRYTQAVSNLPSPVITPRAASTASAFTYLVTPQFKVSPDLMIYARLASGYRPGGPNPFLAVSSGAPAESKSDKTQNYELGMKADFFDRALSLDASLYHIDWKDIQIGLRLPLAVYTANGGRASSDGAELTVTIMPRDGLTITSWAAYNKAELTDPFPATSTAFGREGDRLPFSTRFSGNLALEQEFALWGSSTGYVGGSVNYVGDRKGLFQGTALRQDLPAYTKADLHVGIRYDSWTTNLFVNNVADKRGLINGGIGYVPADTYAYIQPRTIGLNVSKLF